MINKPLLYNLCFLIFAIVIYKITNNWFIVALYVAFLLYQFILQTDSQHPKLQLTLQHQQQKQKPRTTISRTEWKELVIPTSSINLEYANSSDMFKYLDNTSSFIYYGSDNSTHEVNIKIGLSASVQDYHTQVVLFDDTSDSPIQSTLLSNFPTYNVISELEPSNESTSSSSSIVKFNTGNKYSVRAKIANFKPNPIYNIDIKDEIDVIPEVFTLFIK